MSGQPLCRAQARRAALFGWAVGVLAAGAGCSTPPHAQPQDSDPALRYVALGDSYTAAPGVPSAAPEPECQRSTGNYPALFATRHGNVDLTDRSCSGATTDDLTLPQMVGTVTVAPQLDAVNADTQLVTLSLGANDNDLFRDMVVTCSHARVFDPEGAPCQNSPGREGQAATAATLTKTGQNLAAGIARIRQLAPDARLIVVGYPQIVPPAVGCPDRLPLATGDVGYVHGLNQALNATLDQAAAESGAEFLDVWALTAGHDICAEDPWIAGVQAMGDAVGLHPRPPEQAAVADALLTLVRDSG